MFPKSNFDPSLLNGSNSYASSFNEHYHFTEMVEFKDQFLCGNWDKKYGLIVFYNAFDRKNSQVAVKPLAQIISDIYESESTSIYNFNRDVFDRFIKPMFDNSQCFSNFNKEINSKSKCLLTISDENREVLKYLKSDYWSEIKVSFTELSAVQFAKLMVAIHSLPEDERDKILHDYNKKREDRVESSINDFSKTVAHVEKPYVLKIIGNDDSSYIQLFETEKEAWKCYLALKKGAMTKCNWTLVEELGFVTDN